MQKLLSKFNIYKIIKYIRYMYRLHLNNYLNITRSYQHNKYLLYSTYSNNKPKPPNNELLIYAIFFGIYYIYKKK